MDRPVISAGRVARAIGPGPATSDFDLDPEVRAQLSAGRRLRPAAVLVPFVERGSQLNLILTRRPATMRHHPGQIAFPGGKVDPTDANARAAALREAHEEIGVDPATITLHGSFEPHETVTGFSVTPFVATLPSGFRPVPEAGEVAEVFEVPASHVLDPENFQTHSRTWRGTRRHYLAVPWGPYYIWGATARMLMSLAVRVRDLP